MQRRLVAAARAQGTSEVSDEFVAGTNLHGHPRR